MLRIILTLFLLINSVGNAEELSQFTLPEVNDHDVVIFGELHGTNEIPSLFGHLVQNALNTKEQRISVFLELPVTMEDSFRKWVTGNLTSSEFLHQGGWNVSFQDGRYSIAMFKLVTKLKQLKLSHNEKLSINFKYEPYNPKISPAAQYADNIEEHLTPNTQSLILVGNYHNQLTLGEGSLMDRLAMHKPFSISFSWMRGEHWACRGPSPQDCGVFSLPERKIEKHLHFRKVTAKEKRWHSILEIETLSASSPAFVD